MNPPKFGLGDIIYPIYKAQQPGKVIAVGEPHLNHKDLNPDIYTVYMLTTQLLTGKILSNWDYCFMDYRKLVADHLRKYETMSEKLRRLENLGGIEV